MKLKKYSKKIILIANNELFFKSFLLDIIKNLNKSYNVNLICNHDNNFLKNWCYLNKINLHFLPFSRKPNFLLDLKCFLNLIYFLSRNSFDLYMSFTPKAGFISSLALFLLQKKNTIHYFTGQVWSTMSGYRFFFYKFLDRLIIFFSNNILVDSLGQKIFLDRSFSLNNRKIKLIANGSICGVDIKLFKANKIKNILIRNKLKISKKTLVLAYAGRFDKDKGFFDLLNAFKKISLYKSNIKLVIAGDSSNSIFDFSKEKNIINLGYLTNLHELFIISDIVCVPSYREGFCNVAIQSSSSSVPIISTNIYGLENSVLNNVTGIKYNAGDIKSLCNRIKKLIKNKNLRLNLGKNGRKYVVRNFSKVNVTNKFVKFVNSFF